MTPEELNLALEHAKALHDLMPSLSKEFGTATHPVIQGPLKTKTSCKVVKALDLEPLIKALESVLDPSQVSRLA